MSTIISRTIVRLSLLASLCAAARADVLINEIMYHPMSENPAEEYVELYNPGGSVLDLSGWKFTSGVAFTFPAATSIAAGGYLVVTANPAAFHAKYPAVLNYIASSGWTGQLSNSSNHLRLDDALAVKRDEVTYADDGDWAVRERDDPDHGHRGWRWRSPADGHGRSLELINVGFDNSLGQNWKASTATEGTPGAANSVASSDIAPVILDAEHFPHVPKSTDFVELTCRVIDDLGSNVTVTLHWRNDGGSWNTASMFDDGTHGDAAAGDGVFGAILPPRANLTIVEFYFQAVDATSHSRTWPALAMNDLVAEQSQNCLFQVDDSVYAGAQPLYRMILRAVDRTELSNINSNTGTPPYPYNPGETNDQTYSHAKFNATWVTHDGTGDSLDYLCGARNRGNGSRSALPQSYNMSFSNANTWKGITSLNLNTQGTPYQLLGSTLYRKAGLTMAESRGVQVRVNGANLAGGGAPSYGFYCANEVQNTDFADHHFPLDSSGNIYRSFRQDSVGGGNLRDQSGGQPAATADPTPYRVNYFKQTNESEDNWADLIGLTKVLAKGHTTSSTSYVISSYDADFLPVITAAVDTTQWEKFMAVNTLADNSETNISNGDGDDYFLYFGVTDPRAVLIAYDLDTVFGRSAGSNNATHSIFRMCRGDTAGNPSAPIYPLFVHPRFAREYLAELKRQLDGVFSPAQFAEQAQETLAGVVSQSVIDAMKTFNDDRRAYILGGTLSNATVEAPKMFFSLSNMSATTTGGTALAITNGYPLSTVSTCNLLGKADCTRTASVKVNGVAATYTPWKVTTASTFATSIGDWQATNVVLHPGLNRLLVQEIDENNAEIEHDYFDVWYDDASVASVSGAIAANTVWTAAGGPYQVTAALTVNSGVTLTIQPGTTVYLASGIGISVAAGGRLLAEGTQTQPIRFSRAPGAGTNGGTITINGQAGAPETHFYYCYFEYGGNPAVACAADSNVVLDHCEWLRNDVSYLHLDGGSFLVSNCIFPTAAAGTYFEGVHGSNAAPPAGGRAIIRDSFFGKIHSISSDYNDVIDFTGGNRPGPIFQFINNVCIGSDDDILDLDGTDAWVEGNIFMHVHRFGSPDSSSAISGGNDGGGGTGSRKAATAIDTATEQITFGSAHGFSTGQEVVATALLGDTFPAATPALHDGGPYFVRAISTTVVKLYLTAANANADTSAINFTGTIGSGISLSLTALGAVSHITMVGNLFYDLDQAATAKEGNFYTFLNNTVINQNNTGSQDAETGVLNLGDDTYHESGGMYAEGNIVQSAVALVRNYPGAGLAQTVTWNNNLFPTGMTWSGAGSGNTSGDALLNDTTIPTPGPYDYQKVVAEIRQKIGLRPGSPAHGTGPNGTDKGAVRPLGVSIGGAPVGTTNATTATLTVGTRMSGSGIPSGAGAWQNGSGWTHYKWRLNGGAWSAETAITSPISLSGLSNGVQILDVAGKNDAAFYQDDVSFGSDARVSTVAWTVDTNYVPPAPAPLLRISEVLAKNAETVGFGGNFPDIIELQNVGTAPANLTGWGLTDNSALPYKYSIPNGTMLAEGARLVIYASGAGSVPQPKTGFGLKDTGDTLTLTRSVAAGGGIADSIAFGAQIADISVGRRESDGEWDMCRPTFGTENVVVAQAAPASVKINEWLADAVALFPNDFIELMNTASLPVNVGNGYVSDNPVEWPDHHQLRQLTFIAPGGYLYLKADDDEEQGPDHLNFKLASEQGELGFFDEALNLIDSIVYGPQTSDISEGRTPNGSSTIASFTQPTPGAPNPGSTGGATSTVSLMTPTKVWKYFQSSTGGPANDGSGHAFTHPLYNDAAWPSGGGVLYIESSALPANTDGFAKTTLLTGYTTTQPYQTYYFRTHFTFNGPLAGASLTAKIICDDGCILYLNGQEILPTTGARIRMPAGAISYTTLTTGQGPDASAGAACYETYQFSASQLIVGDNVIVCEVHQVDDQITSGVAHSSDITWGMKLDATVVAGTSTVTLNEVLPINATLQNPDSTYVGWIELLNVSASSVDISDLSITDDLSAPRKYVVPPGVSIAGNSYRVFYLNGAAAASATNTGFALNGTGGGVYVFRKLADGGGLQDSVSYGQQIPDFSLGRSPNGSGAFALCVPTRSALNTPAGLGSIANVKINEWLAAPSTPPGFFELYNTGTQPVALGGSYLTDQLTDKTKNLIAPLTFIGGTGAAKWRYFIADNDGSATPGHVNFSLNPLGENIGLFSGAGVQLDAVSFGMQSFGISEGRYPDGTGAVSALMPTPGAANMLPGADTDGDGIPDAWETANGLNPNDPADAALDRDGDGQSNMAEYLAGTNPNDPLNVLKCTVSRVSGQPVIQFVALANQTYTVQFKDALSDSVWSKLVDVAADPATRNLEVTDLTASGQVKRFYRLAAPMQP